MGIIVASAGCMGGDYVPNRDIVIIKLGPDGSTQWIENLDTGFDDYANDMIQLSDRDYLVVAQNTSVRIGPRQTKLIRISPLGTIVWDKTYGESHDDLTSIIQTRDGGFAAVSFYGQILRFDPDGSMAWTFNPYAIEPEENRLTSASDIAETSDGGFIVTGMLFGADNQTENRRDLIGGIIKIDQNGNHSWTMSFAKDSIEGVTSIREIGQGKGFLATAVGSFGRDGNISRSNLPVYAILLNPDGSVVHASSIGVTGNLDRIQSIAGDNGFGIIFVDDTVINGYFRNSPVEVSLDTSGNITRTRSVNASTVISWTSDGGFISAGFPRIGQPGYNFVSMDETRYGGDGWSHLHVMRFNNETEKIWDHDLGSGRVWSVQKIFQASDGGYVILGHKENFFLKDTGRE
ncbi:MAG: hypothetical protein M0Q92_04350 [Methanoregula sp.]|nr:hypothetical protein [Methanoregula sp.]